MSNLSSDLVGFLDVVDKVAGVVADTPDVVADDDRWTPAAGTGLWTLARDTAQEGDAREWLGHVVRVAASRSASLGFVLAGRYVADLCLNKAGDQSNESLTFALVTSLTPAVAATSPTPDAVVLLDVNSHTLVRCNWTDIQTDRTARTGLAPARLATLSALSEAVTIAGNPAEMLATWELLIAAALIGVAERAVTLTSAYVLERRQFGVPIGSFAGLRALVAEMSLRVEPVRAQLDQALRRDAPGDGVAGLAGRAAVDNCLDAIQAHGGYGYIEEYPIAGLLRDAISLRARSGGRRLHVARVATRLLGEPAGKPS